MVKNPLLSLVPAWRQVEYWRGSVRGLLQWAILLLLAPVTGFGQSIGTIAGDGTTSILSSPSGVFVDAGDTVYVADRDNHRVRKVDPSGAISTIAGDDTAGFSGDGGQATSARLHSPVSVCVDGSGRVYIADRDNHRVRRVSAAGVISTIAGTGVEGFLGDNGPATSARLNSPSGVSVDGDGILYIADRGNHRVRRVTAAGTISTIAGNGTAGFSGDSTAATGVQLNSPSGVFVDGDGNVYIADRDNHRIRKVSPSGAIETIAGNGTPGFFGDGGLATGTSLAFPTSVWRDTSGIVYVADQFNQRVRRVLTDSTMATAAGSGSFGFSGDGGPASVADLRNPVAVFGDSTGNVYIADSGNHRVRRVTPLQVRTPAAALAGTTAVAPNGEIEILTVGMQGDGINGVSAVGLRISDLTTSTGLQDGDLSALRLYRSADENLDPADDQIGSLAAVELDSLNTIEVPGSDTPANLVERFYIVTAIVDTVVTEGHAFRVGFPARGISTTLGGMGSAVVMSDSHQVTIDVIAERLAFAQQPAGSVSGVPLATQPIISAMDAYGNIDTSFADTIALTESSPGSLQNYTATPDSGWVTFTGLTYVATEDNEAFILVADDQSGGNEGDLPAIASASVMSNMFNDPPRVYVPPFILDEDTSFRAAVADLVTDPDDTVFTWQFISDHIGGTVEDGQVSITPELHWFGTEVLTIVVTDSHGAQGSDEVRVEVRPRNDAPELTFPDTVYADEGDTLTIPLQEYVLDPETPIPELTLSYSVSAGLSHRLAAPDTLELWAPADSSGQFELTMLVRDPLSQAGRDTAIIYIRPVNSPPALTLADTTMLQDSRLSLFLPSYTHDADDSIFDLIWSASTGINLTVVVDTTGRATIDPDSAWTGVEQVVFAVRDPAGATGAEVVRIEVLRANLPPTLSSLPDLSMAKGDTLSLDLTPYVSDPDDSTGALQWEVAGALPDQATIEGGVLSLVASLLPAHTDTLAVRATDPSGRSASDTMRVFIVNQTPQIVDVPDLELELDTPDSLALDPYLGDDGGLGELTMTTQADSGLVASLLPATRTLLLQSLPGWAGQGQVIIRVSDVEGASAADTLTVTVVVDDEPPLEPRSADFDGNGKVDLTDFFHFADHFGSGPDDPGWDPVYDLDRDGRSGFPDFFLFAEAFTPIPPEDQVQVAAIPDVSFALNEIFRLALDDYLVSGSPADVTWTASGGALTQITISPTSHQAVFNGLQLGQDEVAFTARGLGGYADTETVQVTVLPAPTTPTSFSIEMPQSITVRRGHSAALALDNYVTQADFPVEQMSWTAAATSGILVSIRDRTAFVAPEVGAPDSGQVAFTATSPQGEAITRTVPVIVQ